VQNSGNKIAVIQKTTFDVLVYLFKIIML